MEDIIVSAPGKVILHGEHAVVYGKRAIAASLNLRTFLRLHITDSGFVQVSLPDIKLKFKWSLLDITNTFHLPFGDPTKPVSPTDELLLKMKNFTGLDPEDSETKHLAGIAVLYLYCSVAGVNNKLPSLDVHVASALPTSAGLGSSAAFSTSLSASLLKLSGHISSAGSTERGQKWSEQDLLLINGWAFQAEKIIHGNPSGIDNSVSTYGGALQFQSGVLTPLSSVPTLSVLLFNTNIPRSTKHLVAGVRRKTEKYPDIMKPVLDAMEGITDECEQLLPQLCDNNNKEEAYHILMELVRMNQLLLSVIGVSHPALEQIVHITGCHGLSSKLTGAGGGGCAFAFLPPDFSTEKLDLIKKQIQSLGYECWQTQVGGPGVTEHFDMMDIPDILHNSMK